MTQSFRFRFTVLALAGFALTGLFGGALTPPTSADVAEQLDILSRYQVLANVVYLLRMLDLVLLAPALVAALRLLRGRGAGLGNAAAALLVIGHVAGAAVITMMAVQFDVLASAADRPAAVATSELIERSLLMQLSAVVYLGGLVLGFLLLGIALWRAGALPRWAAACIGLGLILHIAGGDLRWTVVGGSVALAIGLLTLALVASTRSPDPVPTPEPART
jgi:hypothetical protein